MKKLVAIALAGATALSATAIAAAPSAASAQTYISVQHHDRYDRRDHRDNRRWEREQRREYRQDRRDYRRWERERARGYWGGRPYYDSYGGYRTGQVYRYYGNSRYVISDYHRYGLPAPRPGYRYYRDDNGNVIMAAIAGGVIGLILGGALSH